jgi:tetratricopeptide (TPR) repeat protein
VYLREQYLSIGSASITTYSKEFLIGLIHMVVAANYAHADLIAPVASYNARWERHMGVSSDRIRVIYNGVDQDTFLNAGAVRTDSAPTVVTVARIDPNKDILTLLEAAAEVRKTVTDARFVVYGEISVPSYYRQCVERRDALGLGENFLFAGHVEDVASAYASGDIVVLSSITEGFPYAVVEAMMSGRPVVATDVGGISEAVDGTGILVPPQQPARLAEGIVRLLQDSALRAQLADEARSRALDLFTSDVSLQRYFEVYEELATRNEHAVKVVSLLDQRREEAMVRGDTLFRAGQYPAALREYRLAAKIDPDSIATTRALMQIAEVYAKMGEREKSHQEYMRARLHLWATTQYLRQGEGEVRDVRQMAQFSPWV